MIGNRQNVASGLADLATGKQLGMIRALARDLKIEFDVECRTIMGCDTGDLHKNAAAVFIEHLEGKVRTISGNDNG